MRGDSFLLLRSKLATSFTNADSHRARHPSMHIRREGWTEVWGGRSSGGGGGGAVFEGAGDVEESGGSVCIEAEEELCYRTRASITPHPSIPLLLTQHRVAWLEQLVLRIANVPHVVVNSSYGTSESTGPLPFLTDLDAGKGAGLGEATKTATTMTLPALVGRRQPGGMGEDDHSINKTTSVSSTVGLSTGSHIVDYLRIRRGVDLDQFSSVSSDPTLRAESLAYACLIETKLDSVLMALRYADDRAWDQVYRDRCVRACLDPNDEEGYLKRTGKRGLRSRRKRGFFNVFPWYQSWTERTVALRDLSSSAAAPDDIFRDSGRTLEVDVEKAKRVADGCYASLDEKLGRGDGVNLLNTDRPSYVDAMLFAHLAEALCNVHLITVLSTHKSLIRFFRTTHETYFGRGYAASVASMTSSSSPFDGGGGGGSGMVEDWVRFNNASNACNAFHHIPIGGKVKEPKRSDDGGGEFLDALKLMQSLAVHCRELDEALADASMQRDGEDAALRARESRHAGETLHRWRMGGDFLAPSSSSSSGPAALGGGTRRRRRPAADGDEDEKDKDDEEEDEISRKNRAHVEQIRRDNRANDELWLSTVAAGTALAFVVAAAKSASGGTR